MSKNDGGPAFPRPDVKNEYGNVFGSQLGMSLRDWFAGQAISNPTICTGTAPDYELVRWFGKTRTGIMRHEIIAKQALEYADAMLAERAK